MQRDARAYLQDVAEACAAILSALSGVDFDEYLATRFLRSAVEREFTIIGEAVAALARTAPEVFASITQARRIVDFRNKLAHEYSSVDDTFVWGIADRDVPILRIECAALMDSLDSPSQVD